MHFSILLLQCSLLPAGIILQGVLLLQGFSIKLATSIGLSFFPRRSDESNTWQGIKPTNVLQTIKFSLWVDRDNFRVWGV
jgi:hypothetical protein